MSMTINMHKTWDNDAMACKPYTADAHPSTKGSGEVWLTLRSGDNWVTLYARADEFLKLLDDARAAVLDAEAKRVARDEVA